MLDIILKDISWDIINYDWIFYSVSFNTLSFSRTLWQINKIKRQVKELIWYIFYCCCSNKINKWKKRKYFVHDTIKHCRWNKATSCHFEWNIFSKNISNEKKILNINDNRFWQSLCKLSRNNNFQFASFVFLSINVYSLL